MSHTDSILSDTLKTQRRIGRLAKHEYGLTFETISEESGVSLSTVKSYFTQAKNVRPAEIPMSKFVRFIGVIPDELLSQLLAPGDRHLAPNEDGDEDLDDLAEAAAEVEAEVRRARHPKSPGGVEIIAIEEERIKRAQQRLCRPRRRRAA